MGQITNGVAKIEVGPTGVNGSMGAVLSRLGDTNMGSASLVEADGTTTDFNTEESDSPRFSRNAPGKITLSFQIADPNLNAFQDTFGGTITGSGDAAQWNMPARRPQKEISIKITPEVGYTISIPRAILKPKFNGALGKGSLVMVDVVADVLTPQDPNVPPIIVGGRVSDDGGSAGQTQTITFASLGTKSITSGPVTLTGTSSSGLPLTYQSTDPTKATVNGNVLTLLAVGTVSIIASQMGNAMYAAAVPVVQQLTITA